MLMEKRVEPLELKITKDGAVDLIQSRFGDDDEADVIRIPYHQIDLVIQWLKEAKAELEADIKPKATRAGKPKLKEL